MKILIAGDSFCDINTHNESTLAWTNQIKSMIPNLEVTCVGQGASSVFSALLQVKEQLEIDSSYDTVIVIVTNHDRLYQTSNPMISGLVHALTHQKLYKQLKINDERIFNKIEAARMYYEFLHTDEMAIFVLDSCLKEIQSLVGNRQLILFPAFQTFKDSVFAYSLLGDHKFSCIDIVNQENTEFDDHLIYNSQERWANGNSTVGKANHTTTQDQTMLAQYFADLIQFGLSKILLSDFAIIPKKDYNLYYKSLSEVRWYNGSSF